jgi:hypothetical protein
MPDQKPEARIVPDDSPLYGPAARRSRQAEPEIDVMATPRRKGPQVTIIEEDDPEPLRCDQLVESRPKRPAFDAGGHDTLR